VGNGPFGIATSNFQAGNFVYVSSTQDGTISGYSITSGSGVLVPVAGSPFAIPAAVLAVHSLSNVLYASTAAGIRAFTIDPQTGSLTEIAGSPFTGTGASALTFAP
jgi:6-phosphogluconolactonase (cycloisomerase 2 family)